MKFVQAFVSALVGSLVLTLVVGAQAQSDTKPGYATIVRSIQWAASYEESRRQADQNDDQMVASAS